YVVSQETAAHMLNVRRMRNMLVTTKKATCIATCPDASKSIAIDVDFGGASTRGLTRRTQRLAVIDWRTIARGAPSSKITFPPTSLTPSFRQIGARSTS